MGLEFRLAKAGEYPGISRFLDQHWARDHAYCRMPELFEWTFRRPGEWASENYSFLLAEESGEMAGVLGGIPFRFNRFGECSRGLWLVNYVVRPEYRKGTSALQLLGQFRKQEFNPVIAFGINPATTTIYRALRGRVLSEIPRHFLVLPEARERAERLLEIANPAWPAGHAREAADAFVLQRLPKAAPAENTIPRSWDECEWPCIAARTIGAARDAAYLNWRYRRHPVFEYRFLAVRDGSRTGLAVWRLETIRRQGAAGREDLDRIGRLLEFLPASPANAEGLFGAFLDALREAGALGADYYGYHGETRCLLRRLGFHEVSCHPEGRAIPSRFQPLDGKGGAILSAMFLETELPPCGDTADCPWYWTKSDSDQDRPN